MDRGGQFILKPNLPLFEEVPADEALTMTLAEIAGLEVPPHGLVSATDESWVYFVRRFDRVGRNERRHQEDFAQLTGAGRETKYNSSLEQVAKVVLVDYLCRERLGLPSAILDPILNTLDAARNSWELKIRNSHLSAPAKAGYLEILSDRRSRLFG